jgi:predicted PurR-regulated permease PerM
MFQFFKKLLSQLVALCVMIFCIVIIGKYLYPNLIEKIQEICENSETSFCKKFGNRSTTSTPRADVFQETIENKTMSFFGLFDEAAKVILRDDDKKTVQYKRDDREQKFVVGEK